MKEAILIFLTIIFAFKCYAAPKCVYNQAYQENYKIDSINKILRKAENCYVLLDPFDSAKARNSIFQIRSAANTVGCYISSGTAEDHREDFSQLQSHIVFQEWDQWPGEYFINDTSQDTISVMQARISQAAAWGCQWIEFDNMDWAFDSQSREQYLIEITPHEAILYNQELCDFAHSLGLKCMAKNTRRGASNFDGITFESYAGNKNWWNDAHLHNFLAEDKLGIIVHYNAKRCKRSYRKYQSRYSENLSFICESKKKNKYIHFEH